jgi:uncharacterized membrane protein YoaK (UPF0700 family)
VVDRFLELAPARVRPVLMLVLTFTTGVVDAVGYLGLDRVFTGNMTGNVVILGMALLGADDLPVLGPLLALLGFMAGAAVGGRSLRRSAPGWTRPTTVVLVIVGLTTIGLAVALLAVGEEPSRGLEITTTTALGAAMGAQAAAARFVAVKDVTTVVVTSTITGLAADSVLGNGTASGADSRRRLWAVLLILAGAAAGAALLRWHLGASMLLAGALILAVAVAGGLHARRCRPGPARSAGWNRPIVRASRRRRRWGA